MSDSYQATYDAVRSRLSNCDVGSVIERVAFQQFDISHIKALMQEQFLCAAYDMQRPSAIYRPDLSRDGNQWCALYGQDLVRGVSGFGDTPDEAMASFDKAWRQERISFTRGEDEGGEGS